MYLFSKAGQKKLITKHITPNYKFSSYETIQWDINNVVTFSLSSL